MALPQFPGQSPGQRGLQRLQQQQRVQQERLRDMQMKAAWDARHQAGAMPGVRVDRLGWFSRMMRGLFTLVFSLAFLGGVVLAVAAFVGGEAPLGWVAAVGALTAMFIARWISRWGTD